MQKKQNINYNRSWNLAANKKQKIGKNFRDNFLGQRDDIIAKEILLLIRKNKKRNKQNIKDKNVKIIDIGAGPHAIVAKKILSLSAKDEITTIDCFDFYTKDLIKKFNTQNQKIKLFNVESINKHITKYDYCLFVDVLHHIGIEKKKIDTVFSKSIKNSKYVIIKDHLQDNFFDRVLLTTMDVVGNLKDKTNVFCKYYNKKSLDNFIYKHNLKSIYFNQDIQYYNNYVLLLKKKTLHFLGLFKKIHK